MAYLKKDQHGYYGLFERVNGKEKYLKYIGKDPKPYYASLGKGAEVLEAIKRYPDLATIGNGQAVLAEYKRRILEKQPAFSKQYRTLVIDPPWPMEKVMRKVRPNQYDMDYPTMSIDEIKALALPVSSDGCHVYLWTTQKFLPDAFGVLEAWGIAYLVTMAWHKNGGFQPINLPQYNCEFVLLGRMGGLGFLTTKAFPTCFTGERREHSQKPVEFYDLVRRVSPEPRVDMFSREEHEGFEQWGNEIDKFRV